MAAPKGRTKPKGSGRQPGKCNGDTAKLRAIILGALDAAGGQKYLAQQAIESPAAFLSLISKVLPRDVNVQADSTINIILHNPGE
jgi:hypothetical protein